MFKKVIRWGCLVALLTTSNIAIAGTLDFTGGYRFEWTEVDNTKLSSSKGRKSYLTNYLYLAPKFIAADGVDIITRFDVVTDGSVYENTYVGALWGANSHFDKSNPQGTIFGGNKGNLEMKASQLYLKISQEFGQIILGRSPFHFGLGMTYNAGMGEFDHFYHNRDMAAYKVMIGDTTIMPMITRVDDIDFNQGQSSGSTGLLVQYDNQDSRSTIGFFKEDQSGPNTTNTFPDFPGYTTASRGGWKVGRTSFFLSRGWDFMTFKMEAGFVDGETGVIESGGKEVGLQGYGVAIELDFPRPENKWNFSAKLGVASGDNPETVDYEGYLFDRNYNIGMLMFNHRLGQYDIFGTSVAKASSLSNAQSVDDEFVSNAFYLAPKVSYTMSDKLTWNNTFVIAQILNNAQNSLASAKDLGLEWDTELVYKYNTNVSWVNQFGLLLPGKAWKHGNNTDYESATTYGFASKAAISF